LTISTVIMAIIFFATCGTLLITLSNWERNQLDITYYEIKSDVLKKEHKFVFISDLHEKEFGDGNHRLLEKIDELNPDFILIGGDLITVRKVHDPHKYVDRDRIDVSIRLLNDLKKKYKVYYGYGNHESRLFDKAGFSDCNDAVKYDKNIQDLTQPKAERLREALSSVCVLDDDIISFDDFDITGLTLSSRYYRPLLFRDRPELTEQDICSKVGMPCDDKFHIMMLHSPLYYREAIDHGMDLVLSGHYHGGTIRLPFIGALMTTQYQFFVRLCAGEYHYKNGTLILNRGLGTHSVNIRINDLPEISFITIKS